VQGTLEQVGEVIAIIRPVDAPIGLDHGSPTIRALNPLVTRKTAGVVVDLDLRPLRRLETGMSRQVGVGLFEILGHVAGEQAVELRVGVNDEMVGGDAL